MLEDLRHGWRSRGVEVDGYLDSSGTRLFLSRIEVAKPLRRRGLGTKAMEDLVELADHYGLLMTLTPATDFGGTSVARLKRFYQRFGFVLNQGRNKRWEISETMYRSPSAK